MMKDIKKYQKAEKIKKWKEEVEPIPWYYDGLENLCNRIHPRIQEVSVSDIQNLSYDTKLIRLVSSDPLKPLAPFRAGQYVGLTVNINGVRTSRPYSLVSSPNQLAYYELGIRKKEDGFVSKYLFDRAKLGDKFVLTEPMGDLYYNPLFHGKDLVFIAGGCGVTPFISMIRNIYEKCIPIEVTLLFGCVTEKDILFREELEKIQENRSNIKVNFILSEPGDSWNGECGFITSDLISKYTGTISGKFFYVVGNRAMYDFIKEEMNSLNVPRHKIIYEAFGVPDDVIKIMGWPQQIDNSDKINIKVNYYDQGNKKEVIFEALCVEPLLNSIERELGSKAQIENGCRSGVCALCRTKMLSGNIFIPPEVTIREVDREYGFIHPCVSYPISDIHLDLTNI
ncbi:MAG: hypothetical protein GF383_01970 [Candidatus Lokiarchaeota archaeon]|nr:hypothetical protein [Candidatus Lokiarchaeota archaeon]MBD3338153.1 hypothetical protein [Candidatus Lokiarchaeota archaeon]